MIGQTLQKMTNLLRTLSPEQLSQYVQNPDPNGPPQFLALSVLQEQEAARNAMSAPPAPQATVAQQLVQQAAPPPLQGAALPPLGNMSAPPAPAPYGAPPMPSQVQPTAIDQGVASLPTPEPQYKSGGIVSFDDGGETGYGNSNPYMERLKNLVKQLSPYRYGEEDVERPIGFRTGPYGDQIPVFASEQKTTPSKKHSEKAISSTEPPAAASPAPAKEDYSGFSAIPIGGSGIDMSAGRSLLPDIDPKSVPKLSEQEAPEAWKGFGAYKGIEDEANTAYGVDPEFYSKMLDRAKGEESDIQAAKRDALLGNLAAGFSAMAQTPGGMGAGIAAGLSAFGEGMDETSKLYRNELKEARKYQDTIRMADQEQRMGRKKEAVKAREDAIKASRDFKNAQSVRQDALNQDVWAAQQGRAKDQATLGVEAAKVAAAERQNFLELQAATAKAREQRSWDIQKFVTEQLNQGTEGVKAAQKWVEARMLTGIPDDIKDRVTKELTAANIDLTKIDADKLNDLYRQALLEEATSVVGQLNAMQRASNAANIKAGLGALR